MIAFDYPSALWAAASATFTYGLDSHTVTFPAGTCNAKVALDWIVSDLTANLPALTWSWRQDPIYFDGLGGMNVQVLASDVFGVVVNASWLAALGLDTGNSDEWNGSTTPLGCWRPKSAFAIRRAGYRLAELGDCGAGATLVRPEAPALAIGRPDVECLGTWAQAQTLGLLLADVASPRRAWVYARTTADWVRLAIGRVARDGSESLYRFTFDAVEEA